MTTSAARPPSSTSRLAMSSTATIALLISCLALSSCSRPPTRDSDKSSTLSKTIFLGVGNFTVVEIDPNGHETTLRWEAFNKFRGNALNVPYEIITISSGDERYVVTDKSVGNNALSVNGVTKSFDCRAKHLRIRIGKGTEIADGADYQSATKCHDWTETATAP